MFLVTSVVSVVQLKVIAKETINDWMKFTVNIVSIFKKGKDKIRRGEELVWVPLTDAQCRCPKLKVQKTYLVMGNDVASRSRVGLIVDSSSNVIKWTGDTMARRLKHIAQTDQRC